ncbi:ABC transporter substrate-binding protein [Cellulomonas composti]|uniref:Peptide ABC transporter substrate-binding protein n=1 Tax=Cellulomonas composti TaxID=266130 RepID=A0A511JBE2_9CELL|nr:ABC transporter substrate-binding protein [Cellulomonas composti]GEL95312.1 peptide ABC transporter substrate-binding protein [Cellulomonas composti]
MRKFATAVAGVAAIAMLATACSGDDDPKTDGTSAATQDPGGDTPERSDKVLVVGMPNGEAAANQNPIAPGSGSTSFGYAYAIYESLMQVNEIKPTEPSTPWLADSIEWNDDYTQAVITPHAGIKWSDGVDFTAEDIQYSIQIRKDNEALNTDFPGQYGDITSDGATVTVNFTTGQFVNAAKLDKLLIVPKHIWESQDPVTYTADDMIGTGPFKLKSFTPQSVQLEPNDDYWGPKPLVGGLRYDAFKDNAGLTTALTTGDAQWGWVFIPDFENTFIAQDPEHFHQVAGGGFGVDVLFLNNLEKPFNDVAFRKALNMVVDRADISATAGYGVWPQIKSVTGLPQPSGDDFISEEFKGQELSVDVDGAKQVLTDAGYTWDGDALVDPDGDKVSFELTNPQGWTDYLDALGIIAEGAKALGADASVNAVVQDTWFNQIINLGDFDASLHWTDGGSTPWNLYSNIMDGASYVDPGQPANWNFGRYKNDEVTAALAAFKSGTTDADRMAALAIVQKHFVEDVPGLVIWSRPAVAQYSTANYTGFPSDEDPYANPQPTGPQAALILSKLVPTDS